VPTGAPVGVGFALGAAAIAGAGLPGCWVVVAHPCTIAIAAAKMAPGIADASARLNECLLN
jgi:hypothetical protein